MIVTLTGQNSFGLGGELRRLVDAFTAEHGGLALERVDGQEADFARIHEALTALPFLSGRKMVVLREPGTNKQFAEKFEQLSGEIPETTDVILVEPKLDKRLVYYKFLKKHTDFREFPELDQHGLARWLADTAKKHGGSLSAADARYLVERAGANQQLLSNELEKLLLYDPNISRQTIDRLTDETPQSTIFQLLEAAFAGDRQRALRLYAQQRALKVEPSQIVAMLAWQLHVLAIIKTAGDRPADQIAQEAKINPFVIRKSQAIARGLSLAELKKLIKDLLKIDVATKRTSIDPDEALQHYLLQLSS
jgi:DNA polymerase III subunit delta